MEELACPAGSADLSKPPVMDAMTNMYTRKRTLPLKRPEEWDKIKDITGNRRRNILWNTGSQ